MLRQRLRCLFVLLAGCACACGAVAVAGAQTVVVEQVQLTYEQVHELPLNNSIEYILDFTPTAETASSPSVVWVHSSGGDSAHPVLVTARQRAGAVTWQLPYQSETRVLYELERTLCPDDTADLGTEASDCAGPESRSAFSLHVSSTCAAPLLVRVRVSLPPVWDVPFAQPVTVAANVSAPRVTRYMFHEGQSSVRLVVSSESSSCAMLSVQNYSCPIAQTLTDAQTVGHRLTMMLSGAVQLSRQEYPRGFYIVALPLVSQIPCVEETEDEDLAPDQLYSETLTGTRHQLELARTAARDKTFSISVVAALTRTQYTVAAVTLLAVFLGFYVVFGALVLAQRWPPFAKHVLPKAVLASDTPDTSVLGQVHTRSEARASEETAPSHRRRRGSDATFDSSDNSDSDESDVSGHAPVSRVHQNGAADTTGAPPLVQATDVSTQVVQEDGTQIQTPQPPFGLPPQLRLAALARRRGRTLRARSDRYLYTLFTVAVFYVLPVIQFVLAFQLVLNVSGSLDICYYNFLCAHRAGELSDFNHVLSNLGYLLLGALFLLQVRRRRLRRKQYPRHQEYGIPAHYGLLSALGAGMLVVAVLSASYHVCPNQLNFQFDTAFMYVLAVLMMVKIYQSRHPDVNARAHATFGVLAVLIALVVWGVLGGGSLFWGLFTVLHVFTFLLLSLRIYYLGQFRLEKESLALAANELRKGTRPLYRARLLMLVLGNALNWLFAIYGLVKKGSDFAGHMLQVLLGNALLYMLFYLAMKIVHGERLRWYAWVLLSGAVAAWVPGLYFFLSGSSDWSATPAVSRHHNHECMVLQFYDAHDLWHMLSAVALYLTFNVLLTWDDGLSAVKRTDIPVF